MKTLAELKKEARRAVPKGVGSVKVSPAWIELSRILKVRGFKSPEAGAWLDERGVHLFEYPREAR